MTLSKALVSLGKKLGKGAVKGALPPLKWAGWIEEMYAEGISGKFSEFAKYSSNYKRWIWKAVAPTFIRKGYSIYKQVEIMRSVGLGIRKADAYKLVKRLWDKESFKQGIDLLPNDVLFGDKHTQVNANTMPSDLRYVLKFNVYDEHGNLLEPVYKSVYLNEHKTKDELEALSQTMMSIMGYQTHVKTFSFSEVMAIYSNPGWQ